MPDRRFTRHRHPLCPSCGYDLVATVADNGRTCPECGYAFELIELKREVRPDDWTVGRGLRRAALRLALKGFVILLGWAAIVVVINVLDSRFGTRPGWWVLVSALLGLAVVPGCGLLIGRLLSKDVCEEAGTEGLIVTLMTIACALIVILSGVLLGQLIHPITLGNDYFLTSITWGFAAIVIVKTTLFADY